VEERCIHRGKVIKVDFGASCDAGVRCQKKGEGGGVATLLVRRKKEGPHTVTAD